MSCLHDYRTINESDDGIMEICTICKKRNRVSKDRKTGRIDNQKYLKEHKREFLQRHEKDYEKIYGKPKDDREKVLKLKQKLKDEADEDYERERHQLRRDGRWRE